jgi:ferredoxin
MTIFYFTSTGNCLAAAKKIGGEKANRISIPQVVNGADLSFEARKVGGEKANIISIPQVVNSADLSFCDEVIGVVFPIYGFGLPKMVKKFLETAKFNADYMFAVGTYGNLAGACMYNVQKLAKERGYKFDYAKSLLTVDNYLPAFEISKQIAKLPEKKTDENLAQIADDINGCKPLEATASRRLRMLTAVIRGGEKFATKARLKNYTVNESCIKCGVCEKICPSGNISVGDKVLFGDKCEFCLGCVHLCPQNAIHLKNERSGKRWINPNVTLREIIAANNQKRDK